MAIIDNLDTRTIGTLIDNLSSAVGELAKDRMVYKREKDMMQEKMEHEKELARVRRQEKSDAGGTSIQQGPDTTPDTSASGSTSGTAQASEESTEPATGELKPIDRGIQSAGQMEKSLDEAYENTECGFCKSAIEYLRDKPVHEQRKGLVELRELRQAVRDGAGRDEVKSLLSGFEVLNDPSEYM